ncbi:hypothetical protein SPONL_56 [uncultured Candidatus Thioglobus sp.]|nr:hypothetical protein SPONL_56 [uncultured Candidatus Thioglobus sp.]
MELRYLLLYKAFFGYFFAQKCHILYDLLLIFTKTLDNEGIC